MIQRIQSVWLLLASVAAFCTLKFSFYSGTYLPDNTYHQLNGMESVALMLPAMAIGITALIAIFLFKNRPVQLWLCLAAALLEGLLVFLYFKQLSNYTQGDYALSAVLHPVIFVSVLLAARGIANDNKMVKESDRLR